MLHAQYDAKVFSEVLIESAPIKSACVLCFRFGDSVVARILGGGHFGPTKYGALRFYLQKREKEKGKGERRGGPAPYEDASCHRTSFFFVSAIAVWAKIVTVFCGPL